MWPAGALPQLRWACEVDWADPAVGLRRLRRSQGLQHHHSVALLQRHQYQLLPMDAPDVPREAWRDAVRWKLKDMVDFSVDDAGIDLLEIPADTSQRGRTGLLAAVAPHAELERLVHAAQDAGTPWQALDLPETALRNLSLLAGDQGAEGDTAGRAQALLGVGDAGSWLVVTAFGELLLARQIEITRAQICQPEGESGRALWDRVALELQRTLDHCDRVFNRVSLSRLLIGPALAPVAAPAPALQDEADDSAASAPVPADFLAYLRELVYLPVQGFDLAELIDLAAVPALAEPAEQTRYLCAIGAALRPN